MKVYWCSGSTYIEFDAGNNDKDPKLKVGVRVKIWKYKSIVKLYVLHIDQKDFLCGWHKK